MQECVNKVFLIGNLSQDPELRHTHNGTAVATLRVATTHRAGDGTKTEWHRVVCWGKHAEHVVERLKKGDRIAAEGRLRTSSWTDANGNKHYRTDVEGRVVFPRGNGRDVRAGGDPLEVSATVDVPRSRTTSISPVPRSESVTYVAQTDAPACNECGHNTVRNGACYVCPNCGATSGCS